MFVAEREERLNKHKDRKKFAVHSLGSEMKRSVPMLVLLI